MPDAALWSVVVNLNVIATVAVVMSSVEIKEGPETIPLEGWGSADGGCAAFGPAVPELSDWAGMVEEELSACPDDAGSGIIKFEATLFARTATGDFARSKFEGGHLLVFPIDGGACRHPATTVKEQSGP